MQTANRDCKRVFADGSEYFRIGNVFGHTFTQRIGLEHEISQESLRTATRRTRNDMHRLRRPRSRFTKHIPIQVSCGAVYSKDGSQLCPGYRLDWVA